jgi:hypothetical protein
MPKTAGNPNGCLIAPNHWGLAPYFVKNDVFAGQERQSGDFKARAGLFRGRTSFRWFPPVAPSAKGAANGQARLKPSPGIFFVAFVFIFSLRGV